MYFSKMIMGLASLASMAVATALPESSVSSLETRDSSSSSSSLFERTFNLAYSVRTSSSSSSSFTCPTDMSYCGWTKSCSCAPGKHWDAKSGCCKGTQLQGAWPKPSAGVYGSVDAKLGAFCACSPYRIVPYDAAHPYCQASLKNVVFLAPLEIVAELKLKGGAVIDVTADISVALKHTCAGLAGLYLESVTDAVALFNTGVYGLSVGSETVVDAVAGGLVSTVKGLACSLGLAECPYDCVSYCTKGCKNYIDVKGKVGGFISGLVGFCVLPDVIYTVCAAGSVVTVAVKSLLCVVGHVVESVLSIFDCGCA